MDHKCADRPGPKVVSGKSLAGSSAVETTPKAGGGKAQGKSSVPSVPPVRGNIAAFRRIQLVHSSLEVVNSVLDMSRCKLPPSPTESARSLKKPNVLKQVSFMCSDQQLVTVSCKLMFRYTEELRPFREKDMPIGLPLVHSETLLLAIRWMRQHKLEEANIFSGAFDNYWEEKLMGGIKDLCQLMDLIMAAHHLGLNVLARHAADYMEERMTKKTEVETRRMQRIKCRLDELEGLEELVELVDQKNQENQENLEEQRP